MAITIAVHTPPAQATPSEQPRHPFRHRRPAPNKPTAPPAPTRRDRVTAIMATDPRRAWSGRELAESLQIKPRNLLTQLAEWTRLGWLTRTDSGTYALATPP